MSALSPRLAGLSRILAGLVVLLLVVAALLTLGDRDGTKHVTVDFQQTNSLYEGSEVRILGVPVGTVEKLTPKGDVVSARLAYDGDVTLPADVTAVVVSPSIVGDRFVQLSPAYSKGARLADGGHVPTERTAVPVELDEVYSSLDDLSVALGPKGANADGSLSSLLDDSAAQLDGQGAQLNETIRNFGRLSTTLSDNKDELFGSLREVQQFVSLLEQNDASVRTFNDSTAKVADVLEGERDDLAATLASLSHALVDVNTLVSENRDELRGNVDNLTSLTNVLAARQEEVEALVVEAPTALSNVALAYDGRYGTLDTRANLVELLTNPLSDPATFLCALLGESGTGEGDVCATLGGLLDLLPTDEGLSSALTGGQSLADMLAVDR